MTRSQEVLLAVVGLIFVVWGTNRFSTLAAGALAIAFGVALVALALFGDL